MLLALLLGCPYDAPYAPALDENGQPRPVPNVISGEVVLDVDVPPAPVIVFVTAASNPMPPYGTGRPATISTVTAESFATATTGIRSASFSVSNVPDGDYVLTALMDVDGDFSPLIPAMGGATCGDVVGAHVTDLVTRALAPVTVADGSHASEITLLLASQLTTERPAFEIAGFGNGGGEVDALATAGTQEFDLVATGIHSDIYDLAGPEALALGECGAAFLITAPDADKDGEYDPHPTYGSLGLDDLWPRIYLQYLGTPNGDGSFALDLAPGESWAAEAVPEPGYSRLGVVPPGGATLSGTLYVTWIPAASHTTIGADGVAVSETVLDPTLIPKGAWGLTVIEPTGQTWTLPNTLPQWGSTVDGYDPLDQLAWITVR